MPYRIALSRSSLAHLQALTAREQRIIRDTLIEQLTHEPTVPTRSRKEMRPNLIAIWELRVENFRALLDLCYGYRAPPSLSLTASESPHLQNDRPRTAKIGAIA